MRRMMAAGVRPDAGRAGRSAWATGGFDRLAHAARDFPLLKTPERSRPHNDPESGECRLKMSLDRRGMLLGGAASVLASSAPFFVKARAPQASHRPDVLQAHGQDAAHPPDHTIRIARGLVELGPNTTISTKLYNGQFPGPLLRFVEGKRVTVDIYNDADTPEQLHWHGQFVPAKVDGTAEEGTPFIPARGRQRVIFEPRPAGFRFYHTHVSAKTDLAAGLYTGQAGPVFIEPQNYPGAYDREVFLTLKEFGPYLSRMEMPSSFLVPNNRDPILEATQKARSHNVTQGYEVAYSFFSVNGRMLGHGEPIRVKAGERVLFHILNASASGILSVVALDGFLVPRPSEVPVLWIAPAERISAIVEMRRPGVWVLGDVDAENRRRGLGIVVEYAEGNGEPIWLTPPPSGWDYRRFGRSDVAPAKPDATIELTFAARIGVRNGFDEFTINGVAFSMTKMRPLFHLVRNHRYRLHMRNATADVHPIHLHRHAFEITSIAGSPTSGVMKDVAMLGKFQEMTIDFTADQPGLSLFHCHMQPHMDFGFMALFDCK
jgi:FtsP/CotA-like multicopper oxidase with cupredoxin domain